MNAENLSSQHHMEQRDSWRSTIGIIVLLSLISFAPSLIALLRGDWPVSQDAIAAFAPWREWAAGELHKGVLPLWNPHTFCGMPFMSNGQTAVLYPPNIVYWLLPIRWAMFLDVFAHHVFLGVGAYLLARSMRLRRAAVWLFVLCVMLGSAVASRAYVGHLTWHASRAFLPWQLWVLVEYLRSGRRGFAVGWSALVALQIYSGHPLLVLISAFWNTAVLFMWMLLRRPMPRTIRVDLVLAVVLVILLSAAQVLPLRETMKLAGHGTGLPYERAIISSSRLTGLVRLLLPNAFGGNRVAQWSIERYGFEEAAYIGVLPMLLAWISPLLLKNASRHVRRSTFVLWLLLPVTMLLALGDNTPLYSWLWEYFPPLQVWRAPARWLEITQFAAAILAAFSLHVCLQDYEARVEKSGAKIRLLIAALYSVALFLACLAAIICVSAPSSSFWMQTAQWNKLHLHVSNTARLEYASYLRMVALQSAVLAITLFGVSVVLLRRYQNAALGRKSFYVQAVLGLIAIDLLIVFLSAAETRSTRELVLQWPPAVAEYFHPGQRWSTALQEEAFSYGLNKGMPLRIDTLGGYDPMSPSPFFEFASYVEGREMWSSQYQPRGRAAASSLLRVAGVTHVLSSPPHPAWRSESIIAHFGTGENERILWRQDGSWPRAYLTRRVLHADLKQQLPLLEKAAQSTLREGEYPVTVETKLLSEVSSPALSQGEGVLSYGRDSNRIEIDVMAQEPSVLVVSESIFPGWHAWVNESKTKVERANFLFRAVRVPAGRTHVALVYYNSTQRSGLFLTLCGLMLMTAVTSVHALNNRRRRRPASAIMN